MATFFRRFENSFIYTGISGKYFRYAIGEIILVVIGILIALQINNWNEERKKENAFRFSLKQLHKELTIDVLMTDAILDGYNTQVKLIDSIQRHNNKFLSENLPYILQSLDISFLAQRKRRINPEFRKSLVIFNESDEEQNRISTLLLKYLNDLKYTFGPTEDNTLKPFAVDEPLMNKYLEQLNIPLRIYSPGHSLYQFQNYDEISRFAADNLGYEMFEYQPDGSLEKLIQVLEQPGFKTDLSNLRSNKTFICNELILTRNTAEKLISMIESYLQDKEVLFKQVFVIGDAIPKIGWFDHLPMNAIDDEGNRWETVLELEDGFIKFRTDDLWTYNWGKGHSSDDRLIFDGPNIPVKKGKYRISIDLEQGNYELAPIN